MQRPGHCPSHQEPDRQAEPGADERGDHALVPHHSADLTTRHADGAHHADLAGALEHGKHERIDHPEQADDDRQREQHVEEHQELPHVLAAEVDPARARAGVDLGERCHRAVDAGRGRRACAIGCAHEHVEVAGTREAGVERGL